MQFTLNFKLSKYRTIAVQRRKLIQIMVGVGGGKTKIFNTHLLKKISRCDQLYINNNKMYQIKIENII